jgi:hypothetical protein
MRTTIELPDDLLQQAAAVSHADGITLQQFLTQALLQRLGPPKQDRTERGQMLLNKVRPLPPMIGDPALPPMSSPTREEIDLAMFG